MDGPTERSHHIIEQSGKHCDEGEVNQLAPNNIQLLRRKLNLFAAAPLIALSHLQKCSSAMNFLPG
jgi:hypothetical protein